MTDGAAAGGSLPFPPGPQGLELAKVIYGRFRDPVRLMQKLHRDHGPIVGIRLGKMSQILVNDPGMIRHVLSENAQNYTKGFGYGFMQELVGQGLLTSDGDLWRKQRRLVQPVMTKDRVKGYLPLLFEETKDAADLLSAEIREKGATVEIHKFLMDLSLNMICRTVLGVHDPAELRQVHRTIDDVFAFIERQQTFQARLLQLVDWQGAKSPVKKVLEAQQNRSLRKVRESVARLDSLIYGLIRDKKAAASGSSSSDLITHLLQIQKTQSETGNEAEKMSDQQLRDEVLTMLIAGYETTSTSLSWCLSLLAHHPAQLKHVRDESTRVLGKPTGESASLPLERMPELAASEHAFQEALRLYPPIWRLSRFATEADQLGEFAVPPATLVVISQYALHRSTEWWGDDADRFSPARFADPAGATCRRSIFLPFGAGPRMCLGTQFALLEAQVVLSELTRRFHFEALEPHPSKFEPWITLRPRGGIRLKVSEI